MKDEDVEHSGTEDERIHEEPKSQQPSDGGPLETKKPPGEEATPSKLDPEKALVDARLTLNKEKARAELKKKKKVSETALKKLEMMRKLSRRLPSRRPKLHQGHLDCPREPRVKEMASENIFLSCWWSFVSCLLWPVKCFARSGSYPARSKNYRVA